VDHFVHMKEVGGGGKPRRRAVQRLDDGGVERGGRAGVGSEAGPAQAAAVSVHGDLLEVRRDVRLRDTVRSHHDDALLQPGPQARLGQRGEQPAQQRRVQAAAESDRRRHPQRRGMRRIATETGVRRRDARDRRQIVVRLRGHPVHGTRAREPRDQVDHVASLVEQVAVTGGLDRLEPAERPRVHGVLQIDKLGAEPELMADRERDAASSADVDHPPGLVEVERQRLLDDDRPD
jgi:hypothetical protein